jgi:hypothetical protein
VEPRDLWDRRRAIVTASAGASRFRHGLLRPRHRDGLYTQSTATLYGNQQEAVR